VDLVGDSNPDVPLKVMEHLLAWDGCDAVIHLGVTGRKWILYQLSEAWSRADPAVDPSEVSQLNEFADGVEADYIHQLVGLMEQHRKPVIGVGLSEGKTSKTVVEVPGQSYKGVFYSSPERAVKSLSRMCRYRHWRTRQGLS